MFGHATILRVGDLRNRLRWLVASAIALTITLACAHSSAAPVSVTVLDDTPDHTVVALELLHYGVDLVTVQGQAMSAVRLAGEPRLKVKGAPSLPTVSRSVMIDAQSRVELSIIDTTHHDVTDVDIAPSKGILYRNVLPSSVPYTLGPAYQQDAFFPASPAKLGQPYVMRDVRGAAITFQPFQYNPVSRVLRVYDRIVVKVAKVPGAPHNPLVVAPTGTSLAFHNLSAGHFLNHGTKAAYAPLDEDGDLLIIVDDAWLSNVQPLVAHKNSIGIDTTAVGVSQVGNNASSIKSYIQNAYQSGNLAFVLLVGDVSQVATPYAQGGAADPTYAKVAGSDGYPDILVGRFSAETAAHVDTQVQRTIDYEVNNATQQPWFKKGVGIGSNEGPGDDGEYDYQHIDKIGDDLLGYGYTEIDEFYGSGSSSQVISALNAGRGIVNYCGHGSASSFGTTGFSNSSANNLSNAGKLPFVLSVACNTGELDYGTCLGEAMLRASSGGQPTGAIAMYASSILQSWDPPMSAQDETIDRFVAEDYSTIGALAFAGSARMIDEYGGGGVEMFDTWHLFGDPSLRVVGSVEPAGGMHVDPGEGLEAEGSFGGPFNPGQRDYTVTNNGEFAIDFSVQYSTPWINVTPTNGNLAPGASTVVTVALNETANALGDGYWQDTLLFINETDHDGDTDRHVGVTVGLPGRVYMWPLDQDPGWTTEGEWSFGTPSGGGGGELGSADPTSGQTGSNVYGYNLAGNYTNNLGEQHLTTLPFDCSEISKVSLRFARWLNVEESIYDHASVSVSNDGSNWTTVWENGPNLTDSSWQAVELDISAVADGQPSVQVRWTMGSTDEGLVASGWNIDDIAIWGMQQSCDDHDGDGYLPVGCGGDDCNDATASIHPGAGEECDDGIDNDCDGAIDSSDVDCGGDEGTPGTDPADNGFNDDAESNGGLIGTVACSIDHTAPPARHFPWLFVLAGAAVYRRRRLSR